MADFVAVIRKAVDNLSDNSPENRAKVYDKARAAIRRQLDAMNPPPPEEVMARQMNKLEQAIDEVEAEHAVALTPEEAETERLMAELEALVDEVPEETPEEAQEPEPASAGAEVEQREEAEDADGPDEAEEPVPQAPPAPPAPPPAPPASSAVPAMPSYIAPEPEPPVEPAYPELPAEPEPDTADETGMGAAPVADETHWPEDSRQVSEPPEWGAEPLPDSAYVDPGLEAANSYAPADYEPAADPSVSPPGDDQRTGVIDDHEHDEIFGLDPRDEAPRLQRREAAARSRPSRQGRRSGVMGIVLGLAVLVLLAVAGYAAWSQRDALTAMFSSDSQQQSAETQPAAETPAAEGNEVAEEDAAPGAEPDQPEETEMAAVDPGQEADSAPRKFTQRLNPDGTETNPGPAPGDGTAGPVEGRSVLAQTEAGDAAAPDAPLAGADEGTQGGEEVTAGAEAAAGEAGAQDDEPVGVAQKMFLYEERLDQSSPAVTEGTVVWSTIEDPENGGPNNLAIRGEISAGEDGLSALITIKRNNDPSLPASHIIELVFALPPDFAGGGIQQVQRFSMKQTEQDQGNPLIAVPAQITADFYMIALNDLASAVQTNTQLLRQRNWIDIPVVYANGRRALITLEKGASGTEVFNQALNSWAAE